MWCERFVIIVTSLHRDFLPSTLGHLHADLGRHLTLFVGTIGLFFTLFLLFLKFVPAVAVSEVKELQLELKHAAHHGRPAWSGRRRHPHPRSALEPWKPRSSIRWVLAEFATPTRWWRPPTRCA